MLSPAPLQSTGARKYDTKLSIRGENVSLVYAPNRFTKTMLMGST